jgi:hypothetical protein
VRAAEDADGYCNFRLGSSGIPRRLADVRFTLKNGDHVDDPSPDGGSDKKRFHPQRRFRRSAVAQLVVLPTAARLPAASA